MTESANPSENTTPSPATGWDYPRLAQTWWLALLALFALPHWTLSPAFSPQPPAVAALRNSLGGAMALAAVFLYVSLILFTRWRDRLPDVTRGRWYGPSIVSARRRGFWILWTLAAAYSYLFLGLIGQHALGSAIVNGAAAYLRPDISAFGIELLPQERSGLVHLRLVNISRGAVPIAEGQQLGEVQILSPTGPHLLGRAQLFLPVLVTPELTGQVSVPPVLEPGDALLLMLPIPGWQVIAEEAPRHLPLDILYFPQGSRYLASPYAPLDLYHGTLLQLPGK